MRFKPDFTLKAGQIVTFSSGEYSDYRCVDTFVAIEDVTHDEMVALAQSVKNTDGDFGDKQNFFLSQLIRTGRFLQLKVREIHMGAYDEIELNNCR